MRFISTPVIIDAGTAQLAGELAIAPGTQQLGVFVHGSDSTRMSPRNRRIAEALQHRGIGTLLFDLRTDEELDANGTLRFDLELLADRVTGVIEWLASLESMRDVRMGVLGEGTGAALALVAAAKARDLVGAVVARAGRAELAGDVLRTVQAPTLLIVGGMDREALADNRRALARLACPRALHVVEGSGRLFDERGALADVIEVTTRWLGGQLAPRPHAWAVGAGDARP
ncbi:MAG: dienelactone hydrolase family protein [Deltaproteobacteria bacterium]|nr:dienelactone hydrolase family protein [Deltaproteobacteria bacterium]